ncbi:MAG: DUF4411 family protein [Spirochaetia bacterium]|nr:DUF4411 family protein [Spirochaetia bacterium]
MAYVLDMNTIKIMVLHYYRETFHSLWNEIDKLIANGDIISVREVKKEIDNFYKKDKLSDWADDNREIFINPTDDDLVFIREIFRVNHFQSLVKKQNILMGKPVADPFVIAKAKNINGIVVTQEAYKKNAAKIPNVCEHFDIECINLEQLMKREQWKF